MRVLLTASTLPRWEGDSVPGFILDQAVALRDAGPDMEIGILAPHHPGAARDELMRGIPVHRFRYAWPARLQRLVYPAILPNLRRNRWLWLQVPLLFVAEFLAILRRCRRSRPDVLYSHWFAPQAIAGGAVAWLLGIPHVFTSHSADVEVMHRLPVLGPTLVRYIVRRARACTVVSSRTLDKLRAFFEPAEWAAIEGKVRVIPMGVALNEFAPPAAAEREAIRERLGFEGRSVILFLGRLTEKKGLMVLLEAMSLLAGRRPDVLLVMAGEGEMRHGLEDRVRALGLADSVLMPGFAAAEQKQQLLASADLVVVPSIVAADGDAEGLPVSLLEALAAGRICVASDASGADDVLANAVNGFVVAHGQPEVLARAMAHALDLAPAERHAIEARARQRAADFDWPVVAAACRRHLLAGDAGNADGQRR